MHIELRELSLQDGQDVYEMLQEIGPGENNFINAGYNVPLHDFLLKNYNNSKGIGLKEGYVPYTVYFLYVDNHIVGYGKLRHHLTEKLMTLGGHMSYCIRPSQRGKGYGNIILSELLKKAKEKNIEKALLTCKETNEASRKIIEANGGKLQDILEGECRYRISI